jgi:hypothetical protein
MRFFIAILLPLWLFAQPIEIEITYGGAKEARTAKIEYKNGETALAVISRVANVKTKKVGEYLFITSIDGVASTPQKMGWFYLVDGKNADKTASTTILKDAKSMKWEYHADNCLSGIGK